MLIGLNHSEEQSLSRYYDGFLFVNDEEQRITIYDLINVSYTYLPRHNLRNVLTTYAPSKASNKPNKEAFQGSFCNMPNGEVHLSFTCNQTTGDEFKFDNVTFRDVINYELTWTTHLFNGGFEIYGFCPVSLELFERYSNMNGSLVTGLSTGYTHSVYSYSNGRLLGGYMWYHIHSKYNAGLENVDGLNNSEEQSLSRYNDGFLFVNDEEQRITIYDLINVSYNYLPCHNLRNVLTTYAPSKASNKPNKEIFQGSFCNMPNGEVHLSFTCNQTTDDEFKFDNVTFRDVINYELTWTTHLFNGRFRINDFCPVTLKSFEIYSNMNGGLVTGLSTGYTHSVYSYSSGRLLEGYIWYHIHSKYNARLENEDGLNNSEEQSLSKYNDGFLFVNDEEQRITIYDLINVSYTYLPRHNLRNVLTTYAPSKASNKPNKEAFQGSLCNMPNGEVHLSFTCNQATDDELKFDNVTFRDVINYELTWTTHLFNGGFEIYGFCPVSLELFERYSNMNGSLVTGLSTGYTHSVYSYSSGRLLGGYIWYHIHSKYNAGVENVDGLNHSEEQSLSRYYDGFLFVNDEEQRITIYDLINVSYNYLPCHNLRNVLTTYAPSKASNKPNKEIFQGSFCNMPNGEVHLSFTCNQTTDDEFKFDNVTFRVVINYELPWTTHLFNRRFRIYDFCPVTLKSFESYSNMNGGLVTGLSTGYTHSVYSYSSGRLLEGYIWYHIHSKYNARLENEDGLNNSEEQSLSRYYDGFLFVNDEEQRITIYDLINVSYNYLPCHNLRNVLTTYAPSKASNKPNKEIFQGSFCNMPNGEVHLSFTCNQTTDDEFKFDNVTFRVVINYELPWTTHLFNRRFRIYDFCPVTLKSFESYSNMNGGLVTGLSTGYTHSVYSYSSGRLLEGYIWYHIHSKYNARLENEDGLNNSEEQSLSKYNDGFLFVNDEEQRITIYDLINVSYTYLPRHNLRNVLTTYAPSKASNKPNKEAFQGSLCNMPNGEVHLSFTCNQATDDEFKFDNVTFRDVINYELTWTTHLFNGRFRIYDFCPVTLKSFESYSNMNGGLVTGLSTGYTHSVYSYSSGRLLEGYIWYHIHSKYNARLENEDGLNNSEEQSLSKYNDGFLFVNDEEQRITIYDLINVSYTYLPRHNLRNVLTTYAPSKASNKPNKEAFQGSLCNMPNGEVHLSFTCNQATDVEFKFDNVTFRDVINYELTWTTHLFNGGFEICGFCPVSLELFERYSNMNGSLVTGLSTGYTHSVYSYSNGRLLEGYIWYHIHSKYNAGVENVDGLNHSEEQSLSRYYDGFLFVNDEEQRITIYDLINVSYNYLPCHNLRNVLTTYAPSKASNKPNKEIFQGSFCNMPNGEVHLSFTCNQTTDDEFKFDNVTFRVVINYELPWTTHLFNRRFRIYDFCPVTLKSFESYSNMNGGLVTGLSTGYTHSVYSYSSGRLLEGYIWYHIHSKYNARLENEDGLNNSEEQSLSKYNDGFLFVNDEEQRITIYDLINVSYTYLPRHNLRNVLTTYAPSKASNKPNKEAFQGSLCNMPNGEVHLSFTCNQATDDEFKFDNVTFRDVINYELTWTTHLFNGRFRIYDFCPVTLKSFESYSNMNGGLVTGLSTGYTHSVYSYSSGRLLEGYIWYHIHSKYNARLENEDGLNNSEEQSLSKYNDGFLFVNDEEQRITIYDLINVSYTYLPRHNLRNVLTTYAPSKASNKPNKEAFQGSLCNMPNGEVHLSFTCNQATDVEFKFDNVTFRDVINYELTWTTHLFNGGFEICGFCPVSLELFERYSNMNGSLVTGLSTGYTHSVYSYSNGRLLEGYIWYHIHSKYNAGVENVDGLNHSEEQSLSRYYDGFLFVNDEEQRITIYDLINVSYTYLPRHNLRNVLTTYAPSKASNKPNKEAFQGSLCNMPNGEVHLSFTCNQTTDDEFKFDNVTFRVVINYELPWTTHLFNRRFRIYDFCPVTLKSFESYSNMNGGLVTGLSTGYTHSVYSYSSGRLLEGYIWYHIHSKYNARLENEDGLNNSEEQSLSKYNDGFLFVNDEEQRITIYDLINVSYTYLPRHNLRNVLTTYAPSKASNKPNKEAFQGSLCNMPNGEVHLSFTCNQTTDNEFKFDNVTFRVVINYELPWTTHLFNRRFRIYDFCPVTLKWFESYSNINGGLVTGLSTGYFCIFI